MIYIGYYLLKTSIVSGIFFLIYQALLRKESFFQMNRFYLLVSLLFSYLFPFVKLNIYTETNSQLPIISNIQSSINQFSFSEEILLNEVHSTQPVNLVNYVGSVLLIGVSAVLLFRFFKHLFQIIKTIIVNDKIKQIKYTLVLLKQHNTFSFFRYIFISQNHLESTNGDVILNHERSHIKNKHTFDRLFIELMTILFWMNPFIYLYRKALEEVHEFQADNDAISTNESISNYFRLVLQHSAGEAYTPLMSPFSYKLIKKRITMSNHKSKSIKKFLFIFPVALALSVVLISNTNSLSQDKIATDIPESLTWPTSQEEASMLFTKIKGDDANSILSDNVFPILINSKGQLLLKGDKADMNEVRPAVMSFLYNSGLTAQNLNNNHFSNNSFVYLQRDISTPDEDANALLNEVNNAYSDLRNEIATSAFNKSLNNCNSREREAIMNFTPNRIYIAQPKNMLSSKKDTKQTSFISPIKNGDSYTITSDYGMRIHPISKVKKLHKGTDFKAELNTPVIAIADGTVREIQNNFQQGKGYGKYIIIDHSNGYSSLYAQLNDYKIKEGDRVKQGDVIGLVGSSGMSTGPHLHLEVKKDGENIDPMKVIK
ncbi:M23/M56 family metallopeptidase [Carboxylicivirga linearis]|uniref:Peptidoglycan DD-metalloendopeptidase family protein n=1 Tax=Carboxylicivirga linearis TaxID=1628157 RepID=A0ABS5JZQ5_9BACT|nr:M23/M56 family metallopeptidase [Carboxylicivirga linearis]MBS2100343.1 peptidoglycan DD-metalloendopeptidase family protein [Carboxylicivirga linearis]